MANTFSQIYIQIVFAVQGRANTIASTKRIILEKYITGIITNRNQKLLAIFAMPDHIHILLSVSPNINVADLVRDIKAGSSKFINDNKWIKSKFSWQKGHGTFSYSHSDIDRVVKYILNQEAHHKNISFKNEFLKLLQKFEIKYDEKYLFKFIDNLCHP